MGLLFSRNFVCGRSGELFVLSSDEYVLLYWLSLCVGEGELFCVSIW